MKKVLLILLCLGLVGCTTLSGISKRNKANLKLLYVGMTKEAAVSTMGEWKKKVFYLTLFNTLTFFGNILTDSDVFENPYRSETLKIRDKSLEILYYYTDHKGTGYEVIKDDQLTPLVFDEDRLIGWSWDLL